MNNFLFVAIIAFAICFVFTFLAVKLFPIFGLLDRPHKYGLKRDPIPYYGGLALVLSFFVTVPIFVPITPLIAFVFVVVFLITIISFIDDYRGLSPYLRLSVQILAGISLVLFGLSIDGFSNPFGEIDFDLKAVSDSFGLVFSIYGKVFFLLPLLFTVFWVVFLMNSINWIDGISGLTSGVGSIASFVLFFLSIKSGFHTVDQSVMSLISLILGAQLVAFWCFDFYPPKILPGDTGSMFVGFMLAVLAVFAGGKIVTVFLVLGFPFIDALWVILRRILSGKSPFKGDLRHLHHRLKASGLSERQVLFVLYAASLFFGFLAIILGTQQKIWALLALLLAVATVGFISTYFSENKTGNKFD